MNEEKQACQYCHKPYLIIGETKYGDLLWLEEDGYIGFTNHDLGDITIGKANYCPKCGRKLVPDE